MRVVVTLYILLSVMCLPLSAQSDSLVVSDEFTPDAFPLVHQGRAAPIWIDNNDFAVVRIAAQAFGRDINDITQTLPDIHTDSQPPAPKVVMIGTLGHSRRIDLLVQDGKLPVDRLHHQWETFTITTVDQPRDDIAQALVIAGSDRRGTAFGVFELSKALGVSPWVWWADVRPKQRQALYVTVHHEIQGPPSVKYRGIFLNDEDWGLQPWAARHMDTDIKDIGPHTYARIFELLLRLKANFIWPAMHPCTKAFYYYPKNPVLADRYAIVVGASHCEPMLRNNVFEWAENFAHEYGVEPGPWRYDTNRDQINRYWLDRVKQSKGRESVYTVGMRGIHDSGMPGPRTTEGKRDLLQTVIQDQRQMLTDNLDLPVNRIPQIFCPYKEVLQIYRSGLKLPDDVTIVWADDNHGYVRQLSTPKEQQRSGASGVYYHLSYWGAPQDYLWLCSTGPALVSFEMSKAFAYGASRLWVFNVGDIKPAEMETEFAMDLAWNVNQWSPDKADTYIRHWAARTFGPGLADPIAAIKKEYYRLAQNAKPEHVLYVKFTPEHLKQRLHDYQAISEQAQNLADKVPTRLKDAYFQLILYPVQGACAMNEKILYARQSLDLARQGNRDALTYAAKAKEAYDRIQTLTQHYNEQISNGKWNGIMSSHPRDREVFGMPKVATADMISASPVKDTPESPQPQILLVKDYIQKNDAPDARLAILPQLGISGKVVTLMPFTCPSFADTDVDKAPYLDYEVSLPAGEHTVTVKCLPTHRIHEGRQLRYGIALNHQTPTIVNVDSPSQSRTWSTNVLRGFSEGQTTHRTEKNGQSILRLYLLDPGLAITKIEIE